MADSSDAVTQRAQARVGQVLRSKWRLDRLLGVGGMASVYAATHRNGKRGAVKMLHLELSIDAEAKSRFLREGYVANKVDHPGAVSVLDDDVSDDGSVFLVMELLEGHSIEARSDTAPGRRLPLEEVVTIADQLLDVLGSAHEKGIVHRDLKPENLFLTRHGQVKVLDFGIARLREMSAGSQATRTGSVMGTPAFMPPEQALGNWNQVDGRTDLWATGATIFRLLSGRAVHEGDNVNKVLLAAMTKPAAPLATVAPGTHPQLCAIVDRALAFEPTHRWPDARSMQAALREFVAAAGVSPSSLGASTAPASAPLGPGFGSQPGARSSSLGLRGATSAPSAPNPAQAGFGSQPNAAAQPAPAFASQPTAAAHATAVGARPPAQPTALHASAPQQAYAQQPASAMTGPQSPIGAPQSPQHAPQAPHHPSHSAPQHAPAHQAPQQAAQHAPAPHAPLAATGALPNTVVSRAYATASPVTISAPHGPRSSSAGIVFVAAAVVVLGIGGTIAYFVTRDSGASAATDVAASSGASATAASATATSETPAASSSSDAQPAASAAGSAAPASSSAAPATAASSAAPATTGASTAKPTTTAKPATSGKKKDVFDKF